MYAIRSYYGQDLAKKEGLKTLEDLASYLNRGGALKLAGSEEFRITSYNVCYTKLLRDSFKQIILCRFCICFTDPGNLQFITGLHKPAVVQNDGRNNFV